MRSQIGFLSLTAAALAGAILAAPIGYAASADKAEVTDEEIVITHHRLGPLSDWAQMQAHNAEYQRLKQKFDPSPNHSPVDAAAADRAFGQPPGRGGSAFAEELKNTETPPAVKAVEDAVSPP